MGAPIPLQTEPIPPTSPMQNLSVNGNGTSYNEHRQNGLSPVLSPAQPPPAYPSAPAPPGPLTYATALYAYNPTDAGDLALNPNDRVAVTEYMNAEWWKGKSERTGQEGIFPRSYVRTEEKFTPTPTPAPAPVPVRQETNYGNMPVQVAQSSSTPGPAEPGKANKFQEGGKKFGKKMGNAAIFGAGATVGSNIVNSIF